MLNQTLNYLLASSPISTLGFSGVTGSSSVYLIGPGGQSGDGFPLTRAGYLTRLSIWNGGTLFTDTDEIAFNGGDRVSLYCQNMGGNFTVKVRLNGTSTNLQVANVPHNSTLFAIVEFALLRP